MPLVAIHLLGRQRCWRFPDATFVFPFAISAGHRQDIGVPKFGQGLGGKRTTNSPGAIHNDGRVLIKNAAFDLRFKVTTRNMQGSD